MLPHWTWTDFITLFSQHPSRALSKFWSIAYQNFLSNWWQMLIAAAVFWVARVVVFSAIDIVVPRSLSDAPPRWARNRFMLAWRDRLRRHTLENRSLQRSRTAVALTKSTVDPLMWMVVSLTMFSFLGLELTPRTGGLVIGAFSLALGLGFQGVIKDMIAGLTIISTDVFAVGDYVDVQFGVSGVVRHIGIRFTTLESSDGTIWSVRHSEIPKVGNLTASKAMIVTEVTLTWNEEDKHITGEDLEFAEKSLGATVETLAQSLKHVDRIVRGSAGHPSEFSVVPQVAQVVPDLVPAIGADTLYDMRAITEEDTQSSVIQEGLDQIRGRVPLFTNVESLGFVGSTVDSVTLRLRISLPPKSSRSQAMAVLRRAVFDTFNPHDISVSFSSVDESELPSV